MGKVQVSLVKYDDFTGPNGGAQFPCPFGVVMAGGVDEGKTRQEAVQIQPQMTFGGGFAPPMLGPVQARGHQLNRGRVHHVDDAFKAAGQAKALATGKVWLERLQMLQHPPEQLLGHRGIPVLVGMGEIIATGRGGPAQGRQGSRVQAQRVANVVEADGMSQLCKKQRHDMTPRAKGAGFLIHPRLPRQLGDQVSGNPVAKLSKNREFRAAWLRFGFLFFHPCRVAGVNHSAKSFLAQAMGCLCNFLTFQRCPTYPRSRSSPVFARLSWRPSPHARPG